MSLPSHAAFTVANTSRYPNAIDSLKASVLYGPTAKNPMLRFRVAQILFDDKRLYDKYKDRLELAPPVHTLMKVIALREPLGEAIIKDGKQTYVKIVGVNETELIQVDNRLLTKENLRKMSQLIKMETGWKTEGKDEEFITRTLKGNDQMSIHIPLKGWRKYKDIASLLFNEKELREGNLVKEFMKKYGDLKVHLKYGVNEIVKVAGGLASAGDDYFIFNYEKRGASNIPHQFQDDIGTLCTKSAKIDALKQK